MPKALTLIPAVHYEADENGYRVTSMETEEIGSGPVTNKEGKAFVQSVQHGYESKYAIMGKQVNRSQDLLAENTAPETSGMFNKLTVTGYPQLVG